MSTEWFRDEGVPARERRVGELEFQSQLRQWASTSDFGVSADDTMTIWLRGPVLEVSVSGAPMTSPIAFHFGYFEDVGIADAQPSFDGYVLDGNSPFDLHVPVADPAVAAVTAIDWFEKMLALPIEVRSWPRRPGKHLIFAGDPPQPVGGSWWWWPGQRSSSRLVRTRLR